MTALPYITIVIFLFLQGYAANVRQLGKLPVKYCNYFILVVFFCFRGYVFTDVFNYQVYFYNVATLDEIVTTDYLKFQWWEPGFIVYMSFFKTICNDYFFYQFCDSFIDLILLYKCLEYFEINNSFSIMVFLAMNGMIMFFDNQRNIKSILIFFYALRYVVSRNWKKYYLCCVLCCLFHSTSIVYFFIYPFFRMNLTKCRFAFICIITLFFALLSSKILHAAFSILTYFSLGRITSMVNSYITDEALSGFLSLGVIEKLLMICLIYKNFGKLAKTEKGKTILKCFAFYILFYFAFFGIRVISERMSMLFIISYWVIVPQLVRFQKKRNKIFFSFFVLTYCILKMSLYSQPQDWYENWLFGEISSLQERKQIWKHFNGRR